MSVIDTIRKNSYEYYAAVVKPGDNVYVAGPITYAKAVTRLQTGVGNDVFAKSSSLAYTAARGASYGLTPVGPEIHTGTGAQYWHYHVYNRLFGTHSLFATWG